MAIEWNENNGFSPPNTCFFAPPPSISSGHTSPPRTLQSSIVFTRLSGSTPFSSVRSVNSVRFVRAGGRDFHEEI